MFLKSINDLTQGKSASLLCDLFEMDVLEVGEKNVVWIVTNNVTIV
jgi:hypothetical protein